MTREIDMSKIEKGTLTREEALYLRDRLLLPDNYEIPGEGEEESYKDQLNALSAEELKERAEGAELDLEQFRGKGGKLSKTKLVNALAELHESAQGSINPEGKTEDDDDED